jgi:16S rRNA processing protein RimM
VLEVGRIVKPHGLKGDVIVDLFTNRTERLTAGAVFNDGSLLVTRAAPHQHRWIVAFDGVTTIDAANALRGVVLLAEPLDDPDALWVHELIGSRVTLMNGHEVGVVEAVQANPASDLLLLDTGALVPLRFVVENGDGRVVIDPPEGLLEIGDS